MSSLRAIAAYVPVKHLYRVDYFTTTSGQVHLTVNKQVYVGRYNSLQDAIEVVKGILTRLGCFNPDECIQNLPSNITEIPSGSDPITVAMRSWDASVVLPLVENPSNNSFDFTKNTITISRSGFDLQGNPVTRQITTRFIRPVRIPYDPLNPLTSQNSLNNGTVPPDIEVVDDEVHARLMTQDYIYSTDTLSMSYDAGFYSGVQTGGSPTLTNTSTLESPPPICNFSSYGDRAVFSSELFLTVDVLAYHASAGYNAVTSSGNINGISAVKFEIFKNNEQTPTATSVVNSTLLDENRVPVYRLNYLLSVLNLVADDEIYVRATVYPYWGSAKTSVRVEYGSSDWQNRYNDFQDIRFVYEPSYCPKIYVSTTGNDANSGDIDNPVATIAAAMSKFPSGASSPCQGFVYCEPGEYTHFSLNSNSSTGRDACRFMLSIEKKPNTTGEVIFRGGQLQAASGDAIFHRNHCIRIKDIFFKFTTTLFSGTGDGVTPGTRIINTSGQNALALVFENCSVECDPANDVVATGNFIWLNAVSRRRFIINNRIKNRLLNGWAGIEGTATGSVYKGNLGQSAKVSSDVCCGNQIWHSATRIFSTTATNELIGHSAVRSIGNQICAYNEIVTTNSNGETVTGMTGNNYAFVCNMIYAAEYDGVTNTNAVTPLWGDNSVIEVDNVLLWHNTVSGGRCNVFYNDTYPGKGTPDPSDDITWIPRTNISIRNNLFRRMFVKSDIFAGNGLVQGNWSVMNSVGCRNNVNFNYAGLNTFKREYEGNDYSQIDNSNGLVLDDPYSGEDDIVGGLKFSGWPRLAPNAYSFLESNNTVITDTCIALPRDGVVVNQNFVGCGSARYPAVYVPDISGEDNREFTSYGTGFVFAIETNLVDQGFNTLIGSTQNISVPDIVVTQDGNTVNNTNPSVLILGAQLILSTSTAPSEFALRFRVGLDIVTVDTFLAAFPGGYIKAYYRGVNDQENQYRELRTLTADTTGGVPSSVYVRASTSSLFELDSEIRDLTTGGDAVMPGLEALQPIRFEFYAAEGLVGYTSPSISFNSVASDVLSPPNNNVRQVTNLSNVFVVKATWASSPGSIYVRVSETPFLTSDLAVNPANWTLIKSGSTILIPNNYYVGFGSSTETAGTTTVTLTDVYNSSATYIFDIDVQSEDKPV